MPRTDGKWRRDDRVGRGGLGGLLHLDKLPELGLIGRLTGATAEEEEDFGQLLKL